MSERGYCPPCESSEIEVDGVISKLGSKNINKSKNKKNGIEKEKEVNIQGNVQKNNQSNSYQHIIQERTTVSKKI